MREFIVHVAKEDNDAYTMSFPSRKDLVDFLRQRGVHFRNSTFSGLGSRSVILRDDYGLSYEVEEGYNEWDKIVYDGDVYISIGLYCRLTHQNRNTIFRAHKDRRIRSIALGKYNLVYIYWGQAI